MRRFKDFIKEEYRHEYSEKELEYEILDVFEALDYKWKELDSYIESTNEGQAAVVEGEIEGEKYRIILQARSYPFENKNYDWLNVVFEKFHNGAWTTDVPSTGKIAVKIIGGIKNAVEKEVKKYNADAIVFSAINKSDKRIRIYNLMARDIILKVKGFGHYDLSATITKAGPATVIYANDLPKDRIESFRKYLKTVEVNK